ncbi:Plant cysteine oxidase 3 [Frankliniella fusca]|uniref:Plant cysteine oxidase 3 n=1 Tax=Frankliniella fusca TaxID=407009 RepID=A0AAE1H6U0_9NEOP|nr:Plant cysteine oxidase 3 [Frankliniella fusca]
MFVLPYEIKILFLLSYTFAKLNVIHATCFEKKSHTLWKRHTHTSVVFRFPGEMILDFHNNIAELVYRKVLYKVIHFRTKKL